ncbi:hypothetical protein AB4K20DRAFT_1872135, partial [Rhizopus microsporus]
MLKYRAKGFDVKGGVNKSWDLDLDSVYSGRNDGSKSAPDAHSINSSSMDDLLREFRELKISLVQSVPPSVPIEAKTTKRRRVQSTPLDGALVATNPTPVGGDGAGNIDVDIIMGETTRTNRQAIKDLVDGCRTLRSRRKKVAVKGENIVITAADPRPREPKLRVVPPIVPPGMTHSNMATAGFGPPQVVGAVDLQDDDGSEWSDVASVSDGSANTWTMDSDDSLSVSSDEES